MKRLVIYLILIISPLSVIAQSKKAEDYGYKHLTFLYKKDTVDILIKSKKGEEEKPKSLLLFCQGSLPQPLIIYDKEHVYNVFPFNTDSLIEDYHLIIISKPYIPLIAEKKSISENFTYLDSTGKFPAKYIQRNLLDYYVDRNIEVIKFLEKQKWVAKNRVVIAGHSEGSTIAAKLASKCSKVTHLIYSGGNPMGRIMAMIEQSRLVETESNPYGEQYFDYWQQVVANPTDINSEGDTPKATYTFSIPPKEYLEKLKIPVLISYGTKDVSSPFNDYFRVEMIREKKTNLTFKTYIGTEHNYFPVLPDGKINYEIYNWDKVANDWYKWLKEK